MAHLVFNCNCMHMVQKGKAGNCCVVTTGIVESPMQQLVCVTAIIKAGK